MTGIKWEYFVSGWEHPDRRVPDVVPSNLDGFEYDVFMKPGPISRGDLSPCCGALTVVHVESDRRGSVHILECTWCRMGIEYVGDHGAWTLPDNMGGFYAVAPRCNACGE